jgi:hypothetical protein
MKRQVEAHLLNLPLLDRFKSTHFRYQARPWLSSSITSNVRFTILILRRNYLCCPTKKPQGENLPGVGLRVVVCGPRLTKSLFTSSF